MQIKLPSSPAKADAARKDPNHRLLIENLLKSRDLLQAPVHFRMSEHSAHARSQLRATKSVHKPLLFPPRAKTRRTLPERWRQTKFTHGSGSSQHRIKLGRRIQSMQLIAKPPT